MFPYYQIIFLFFRKLYYLIIFSPLYIFKDLYAYVCIYCKNIFLKKHKRIYVRERETHIKKKLLQYYRFNDICN